MVKKHPTSSLNEVKAVLDFDIVLEKIYNLLSAGGSGGLEDAEETT